MLRLSLCSLVMLLACGTAWAQTGKKADGGKKDNAKKDNAKKADEPLRFRMNPHHANVGKVSSVTPEGIVRVADLANPRFAFDRETTGQTDLSEGYYLGIIAKDFLLTTEDAKLLRVQVVDVAARGAAVLRVGLAAARNIKPGDDIVLFRPPGATTTQLKAAPDFAPVEDTSQATALGGSGRLGVRDKARLTQSRNNLRQVGLAYHQFHDTYNGAPPTYLADTDGKPLLSWRVLLLPYIEENQLYQEFRFDEPWDGPNNKKLLERMPKVYADPIHGDAGIYTHYAAITGKDTAFPATGPKVTDGKNPLGNFKPGRDSVSFGQIVDGTSNTIIIGSVSPDRKIPWTKPEDIELTEDFPALGKSGSFATPYRTSTAAYGVFLFGDASVHAIRSDIEADTLRNLLRINDGRLIDDYPTLDEPQRREPSTPQVQMIEIIRGKDGVKARFITAAGTSSTPAAGASDRLKRVIVEKTKAEKKALIEPGDSSPPKASPTPPEKEPE